jgi:hypothetical protein
MTAMEGGNATGLPGATLAHSNEITKVNKLLVDRPITVSEFISV